MMESFSQATFQHPYYPLGLKLDGYKPPQLQLETVGIFFGGAAVLVAVVMLSTQFVRRLTLVDRLLIGWFLCSAIIHFVIEGFFVITPNYFKQENGGVLVDIWKEYTKADSRYATRDAFVVSMEAVTAAAWGPLCALLALGIVIGAPWVPPLQLLVSLGQIYGDVLYYMTAIHEGLIHSRPEPLYYYGYFIATNAIWILVPSLIIIRAFGQITSALSAAKHKSRPGGKQKKSNAKKIH